MAQTKLTLKLNSDSIFRAKKYAEKTGISLSSMVEKFFDELTIKNPEIRPEKNYSPLVNELSGIITLSEDFDYKSDYLEHLETKYE